LNPRLSLFIGLISISIFPVLVKWAPVSGISSAFYRMFIGLVCILPYSFATKQLLLPPPKLWVPIIVCGLLFGTDIAVWNLSIHYSNATQATLLTNLSPIWVGIASFFFLNDKPDKRFWFGALVALVGLLTLLGLETLTQMKLDKGFSLALLSGLLYAAYMITSKKTLNSISIVPFITQSMAVSSIYLALICLVFDQPLWDFTTSVWLTLAVQGVICQLLGWLALSYAIKKMDAQRVSLALLSQGAVTALMAWFFIDEKITTQMIAGGLIILAGIAITFKKKTTIPAKELPQTDHSS
jgi:drug/metabolite transporter (DMT)-like permease